MFLDRGGEAGADGARGSEPGGGLREAGGAGRGGGEAHGRREGFVYLIIDLFSQSMNELINQLV